MSFTVGVIGQGYVGLEVSISLVKANYRVIGFERDLKKVEKLQSGFSNVENVSSDDLNAAFQAGKLTITVDMQEISQCEAILICVPTPLEEDSTPDLSMLNDAVESICKFVNPGTLIVNESTSFPGTLRSVVASRILNSRSDIGATLKFGVAPERVSPGDGNSLHKVPRVVSGLDEKGRSETLALYSSFCESVMQVDTPEIAEAAKLLENTFRQINISFINEFNLLCRKLGIDTREVIRAASTKPFGFMPFSPSVGIGGHCIPVDPLYFQHALSEIGEKSEFIGLASRVNNEHPSRLIEFVLSQAGVKLPKILILGVAYKRGIVDTRETPALTLIEDLNQRGLIHGWFDPLIDTWNGEARSDVESDWDIALILTAQPGLPIENLISRGVQIFDFTGEYLDNPKVIQV